MYLVIRYVAHDIKLVLCPNPFTDRLEDNEMTYNAIEAHYHNVLTSNALVRVTMEHQVPVNRVYFVTGTVIRVKGCEEKERLNGKVGVVSYFDSMSHKYKVFFED